MTSQVPDLRSSDLRSLGASTLEVAGLQPLSTFPSGAESVEISVVTTVYKSRQFLDEYLRQCLSALEQLGCTRYELVFVNDGSPDDSLQHLLTLKSDRRDMVIVDLSRNFGHHQAILAGLSVSRGELVFLVDCDLEVTPTVLVDFYNRIKQERADVVYGYQDARKGGYVERVGGQVFFSVFNRLSDVTIPVNLVTERLMTRRYVNGLLQLGDRNLYLAGMMQWAGFKQVGVMVSKKQRDGASTYTLLRRVNLMVDAITSFSSQPLVWLFHFGLTITTISFFYGLFLFAQKLVYQDQIELGYTSIAVLIVLSLGIVTMCLGVIGIYLAKIYNQVRGRPIVVIRDVYR